MLVLDWKRLLLHDSQNILSSGPSGLVAGTAVFIGLGSSLEKPASGQAKRS